MASSSEELSIYVFKLDSIDSDKSDNYVEALHEHVISLINGEQYDYLVKLCQEILDFDPYIPLVKKIVFTLINLNQAF